MWKSHEVKMINSIFFKKKSPRSHSLNPRWPTPSPPTSAGTPRATRTASEPLQRTQAQSPATTTQPGPPSTSWGTLSSEKCLLIHLLLIWHKLCSLKVLVRRLRQVHHGLLLRVLQQRGRHLRGGRRLEQGRPERTSLRQWVPFHSKTDFFKKVLVSYCKLNKTVSYGTLTGVRLESLYWLLGRSPQSSLSYWWVEYPNISKSRLYSLKRPSLCCLESSLKYVSIRSCSQK